MNVCAVLSILEKKICKKKKLGKWHYTKRMSDGTYKVLNKFQPIGWFDCESKCMRIVFFYSCLQLFHEFHLEFYYYRRRATNWSKKWHKDRKNGREREREKENKIKIQDGFQVLSNRFKWNYLVFYLKKGISFTLSLSNSFVPLRRVNRKLNWKFFLSSRFERRIFKNISQFYCTCIIVLLKYLQFKFNFL